MIRPALPTLCLFAVLAAGTARGGTISIASSSPTVMVGQSVTLTVSIDTTDPGPVGGPYQSITYSASNLAQTGIRFQDVNNFRAAPGTLPGIAVVSDLGQTEPAGSASIIYPFINGTFNQLSSFTGPLYQFDFTPEHRGTFTFAFPDPSAQEDLTVYIYPPRTDYLTGGPAATIMAFGATSVPEPTGLALAGVCLSGLALRAWRKRRAA